MRNIAGILRVAQDLTPDTSCVVPVVVSINHPGRCPIFNAYQGSNTWQYVESSSYTPEYTFTTSLESSDIDYSESTLY